MLQAGGMSASAAALPASARPVATGASPFLVNARFDLGWFFASMAVPYAMALGYAFAGPGPNKQVVVAIYVAFQLLFNMPHNAQTWTLTFMEPAELQDHATRYWGSVMVMAGVLVLAMGLSPDTGWPLVNSLVIYWGYWHLIKQHFGFLRIYEARRRVFNKLDQHLSRATLYVAGVAPLVDRIARGHVTLDAGRGPPMTVWHVPLPVEVAWATWGLAGVLIAIYLMRQVQLASAGKPHAPLAVATLLSAVFNFVVALQLVDDLIVGVAVMTVWHNIQYLALVWFMSRNRAARQGGGRQLVRLAGQQRLLPYMGWLLLYAVVILALRVVLPAPWGALPITLVVALHYFHDSFIWKISSNPNLRADLGLVPAAATPPSP